MMSEVLWHSPDSNFTENTSDMYRWNEFDSIHVECTHALYGARRREVNQINKLLIKLINKTIDAVDLI